MNDYEKCRKSLENLKLDFDSLKKTSLNEANTRFKLIDKLLIECLNWERNNISCEDSYKGKYTDYILSLFRTVAVVEAKKNWNLF